MTQVKSWVREICEEAIGTCPIAIGQRWIIKGKLCQITGGQYWGTHGLSNHWNWQEVNEDGTLGAIGSDYGRWHEWKKIS
jgi:hypothetical protein